MATKSPSRWLLWFSLTLGALTALALFAALRATDYRRPALNFYALHAGEYFDVGGLTRRQGGSLKLGFAESYPAPPIGIFGNHIAMFFGADAFDIPEQAEQVFNYSYANLSLPETVRFLHDIEARGRLPTRLMIVAITPPNADNGHFIIDHGNELPPEMMFDALGRSPSAAGVVDAAWQTVETRLHEVFNYNSLVLGLLQDLHRPRETGPYRCQLGETDDHQAPGWYAMLPWTIRYAIDPREYADNCDPKSWWWSLRRDGSTVAPPELDQVRDEDALDATDRGLRAGDEREIVQHLRAIDAIGRRNDVKVVFLITPVFESERRDSVVNQIMDRALAMAPELEVIDDRGMHNDASLLLDYLHPLPKYYRLVAEELRRRGLVDHAPHE